MEQSPPNGEDVVGLTLYLAGSFDPGLFLSAFVLRPVRYERVADNTVTVVHRNKPPLTFVPARKLDCDRVKFSVPGPKSIPELFDALLGAIAALPPAAQTQWDLLIERTADLGLNWTNCSNCGTEYEVPSHILRAMGDARVSLRISVYATTEAIDSACSERALEEKTDPLKPDVN